MAKPRLNYTDESLFGKEITLTNCDREPIHIPGLIQPFGFLVCYDEVTRRAVQTSANTGDYIGQPAEALLGTSLAHLLPPECVQRVEELWEQLPETPRLLGVRLNLPGEPAYKLIVHRYDELLWAEFEPVATTLGVELDLPTLHATLSQMIEADSVADFSRHAAEQVRRLSGFDRVMVYRFAPDGSGEVIAETHDERLEPFLGLRYPATDIPQQARLMYLRSWLRFIPDVGYAPVPLHPVRNPQSGRPPDMTYSMLRGVSPIHVQYLQNMGVSATMSISLIQDGQLWGLIIGHHYSGPLLVSYELRDMCAFIGKTFSALLKNKEQRDEQEYQLRIRGAQLRLFDQLTDQPNFIDGLHRQATTLLDVFDCGGAAVCFEGEMIRLGTTPDETEIRELVQWMQQHVDGDVFHTDSYPTLNPELGLRIRKAASGILAISLAKEPGDYIFWFRPELVQTVTWAGRQQKQQEWKDGQLHLSPRQSFEAWKQLVENTAAPWRLLEVRAAQEIRLHIADIRLKIVNELQARALRLSQLNAELTRSNDELDSFAYVASHDLKEPLRGIHNYSLFLLEDYADKLDDDGVNKLQTLVRLSKRMEALIESLLQLSRIGRQDLSVRPVDLNELLREVLDLLLPRLEQTGTVVHLAGPLPTVLADRVRLGEVFNNLLTNAMRYNDKPEKLVTIGEAPAGTSSPHSGPIDPAAFHVLYVRDNGIGIDPRHHEAIFRIFKRLHSQDKYGGGTGAGLAIVRKMVEKHGGELWVDSESGRGATFFFTLAKHLH